MQQNIKYNGSGGSSYVLANNQTLTADGSEATVISSSSTLGGGSSYDNSSGWYKSGAWFYDGLPGSASIKWVSK